MPLDGLFALAAQVEPMRWIRKEGMIHQRTTIVLPAHDESTFVFLDGWVIRSNCNLLAVSVPTALSSSNSGPTA